MNTYDGKTLDDLGWTIRGIWLAILMGMFLGGTIAGIFLTGHVLAGALFTLLVLLWVGIGLSIRPDRPPRA